MQECCSQHLLVGTERMQQEKGTENDSRNVYINEWRRNEVTFQNANNIFQLNNESHPVTGLFGENRRNPVTKQKSQPYLI